MGKGSRNRINREAEPKVETKKKIKRWRKPMSGTAKGILAGVICLLIVAGIVLGSLLNYGTFKRGNILVEGKNGPYSLNQQSATYMVWDACYYAAYVQWSYLQTSIKETTGITDQTQWCLYSAMSGVQDTLLSSVNTYGDTLREYIAVCDYAASKGITLTKEEKKQAADDMEDYLEYLASSQGLNLKGFINFYIGCNVKWKDIKLAAEIQALCQKVYDEEQTKHQNTVDADLTEQIIKDFVKNNPEQFYSTDYLSYSTTHEHLRDELLGAKTLNEFKAVLVKHEFEEGSTDYRTVFNKHATALVTDSDAVLSAIKGKKTDDELNAALAEKGMEKKEYDKNDESLNADLKAWMFDTAKRTKFAADVIYTEDTIYVAVIASDFANDKVTAAVKEFSKETGEKYGEDEAFKTNILNTLLVQLELIEKTDEMKLYNETTDEKVKKILDELKPILEKAIPAEKSQALIKEAAEGEKAAWEEGSYQEWMFKGVTDDLVSPVKTGDVKSFTKEAEKNADGTKKGDDTFSVYMIVDPIKLDTDPVVNGGYLKFEGTDHASKAQEFFNSLNGLTGEELTAKFAENSSAVISEAFDKDAMSVEGLADWLFDESRTKDSTGIVPVADSSANDKKDDSCTYVAFYLSEKPTWKNNARNAYVNDELSKWVQELIKDYELTGLNRIKDQNPPETSTGTAEAATA